LWVAASLVVVAAFLAAVSQYYHRGFGFTALIEFPGSVHFSELPVVQTMPHFHDPASPGYDGQFYSQLSIDPLLRDPEIDHAMDLAPYRARRILCSWIAFGMGLGRPVWILQAYSIENILTWLIFAWVLTRWMPPTSARGFALWAGTLLSHGMLASVRYALVDAPSTLIVALGVIAAEKGRPWIAAALVGIAGLARETSLLAASMFARLLSRRPRTWIVVAGLLVICVIPLALWFDYLRSIYRSTAFEGGGNVTTPLAGIAFEVRMLRGAVSDPALRPVWLPTLGTFVAFLTQAGIAIVSMAKRESRTPWALVATSFAVLALFMHPVVWEGWPGAFTRVLLPLSVGANVLLAKNTRTPWPVIVLSNLGIVSGVMLFKIR